MAMMRRASWQSKAMDLIQAANPGVDFSFEWLEYAPKLEYPTGYKGRKGVVAASAPGFKRKLFIVESDLNGSNMSCR